MNNCDKFEKTVNFLTLVKSNFLISLLLLVPVFAFSQLPDSIVQKIRNSTDKFSVRHDEVIPITGSATLPCLDVKINGKGPYRFLVDLGSNVMVFKQSVVEAAGVKIIVDRSNGDIVKADKFEIGNSEFIDVHGAAYNELDVDGVIGFNLLRKSNFFLDYPNMKFGFISNEPAAQEPTSVKYSVIGRMPYLESKIGNKTCYINFDTGASLWLYFPLNMKDSVQLVSPIKEFKQMSNNQTGKAMTYIGQLKNDVFFGNFRISSPHVIFDPEIEDVFFGSSLLNQFKLTFYTKQEYVNFERNEKGNMIVIPEDQKRN